MAHPTVVIELFEDKFEALHSNTDISFVIVNRIDDEYNEDIAEVSGPYAPTLETANLATVVEGIEIPNRYLNTTGKEPFFTPTNIEIVEPPVPPDQDDDDNDEDEEGKEDIRSPVPYF